MDASGIPAEERIRRYRELAAQMTQLARDSRFAEIREQFLELAAGWTALALEVAQQRASAPGDQSTPALFSGGREA
jgi:hypothetical protein